ncbi:MAG TPA: ABC transporter substrate-binding protein [Thermoplasmata archaeon]|nr:ABC transporter substrate-binding protein [Thermoplasmata archaeon]
MRHIALSLLAVALLLALVPAPTHAFPVGGPYGGELRVALQGAPSVDPALFPLNRLVQSLVYDSMTRLGTDQLPVPSLAASWTVDGSTGRITMELRPATWPDGVAISAGDVEWSFQRHLAAGTAAGFAVADVDPNTVEFTFTTGGGDFLGNAATLPIAWKSGSATPAQNGPYVLAAQTASALELAPNDRYWNGRPYLDRLTFAFPYTLAKNVDDSTRTNDAACALMFQDVQLIGWAVSSIEVNTERDCVAGFGGFADGTNRTLSDPSRRVPHVGTSDDPALQFLAVGMNTQRAPLDDPRFRQAVSRAIDRDLIVNFIEPGTDFADSPVTSSNAAWFNASVPKYRVPRIVVGATAVPSLEPVNQYLNEIGYLDRDGDGWRDRPAGGSFAFVLLTPDQRADPRVAKYLDLITKFHSIGINLVQEEHTLVDLRARVAADAFDLFVDWIDTQGEPAFLFDQFHTGGATNVVNLVSPTLDGILEAARDALDPAVRRQAVLDAQGWIAANAPIAPVVHMRSVHAYDKMNFEGWVDDLGGIANPWTFTSVHITEYGPLTLTIEPLQPSLRAGAATDILVRTRDANDDPVAGVELRLTGVGLAATTGVTDSEGEFRTSFTAPAVSAPQEFTLAGDAAKAGYGGTSAAGLVVVHPFARSLLISLSKGSPTIPSGNSTFVRVIVLDETNASPAVGVTVTLTAGPDGLGGSFAQASGVTDGTGMFQTTFTADVTVQARFLIAATVSGTGFEEGRATTSIEVSPVPTGGAPPTPALDTVSMVALVALLAALYGAWQRRKWTQRKP